MTSLLIDCETFSEVDVTKVGSHEYANHPSKTVLLWSVRSPEWARSLVFEEANLWKLLKQLKETNQINWTRNEPLDLIHWSPFDRQIVEYGQTFNSSEDSWDHDSEVGAIAGPNNTFWFDLSELSLIYGGPMKLKFAAKFWANNESKDDGKHLISRFCSPQKDGSTFNKENDPIRWEQFRAYAAQDTNVMVPIFKRFVHLAENGGADFDDYWSNARVLGRMNERGVPIDRESARIAQDNIDLASSRMHALCTSEYGFAPTAVAKVREYLGTEDCRKETIEDYYDSGQGTKEQQRLAEIRLLTSGVAAKKIGPMLNRSTLDARARDCFVFHGATTGRLTSMGPQFHNMLRHRSEEGFFTKLHGGSYGRDGRNEDRIFSHIRENIRGFIQAPDGKTLVAADFSQIELRVGAAVAGEGWLLEAFEEGRDPYLIMASKLYGVEVTEKSDPRRQFGKIVELAALYGLGRFGLMKAALKEGIALTEKQAQKAIDTYRSSHPSIVKTWAYCGDAWTACKDGLDGTQVDLGAFVFERIESAVKLTRPSGFSQYYWMPRTTLGHWADCEKRRCKGCKSNLTFTGRNQGGVMGVKHTYGGDLFQSGVQGIAADLILHGMGTVEAAGYPPILSVHDEVVCEIDDDGDDYVQILCDLLCQLPDWAEGLPVAAEGWQQRRFTK